jgi:hypothetical protein
MPVKAVAFLLALRLVPQVQVVRFPQQVKLHSLGWHLPVPLLLLVR